MTRRLVPAILRGAVLVPLVAIPVGVFATPFASIGLLGVSSWTSQGVALADWRDVNLREREVVIAFDSDVMTKTSVRDALDALAHYLAGKGARVRRIDWQGSPRNSRNPQKSRGGTP